MVAHFLFFWGAQPEKQAVKLNLQNRKETKIGKDKKMGLASFRKYLSHKRTTSQRRGSASVLC
jgi:hypothetical protein